MATYAIGDVQGCYDELQAVLQVCQFDPANDSLWFVGDLVNRGPKSLETLRFVKSLANKQVVLGNHDLHLLTVAYGAQAKRPEDTIDDVLNAPDREELLTWLRQQPLFYHDAKFTMVHAGIPPQWHCKEAARYAAEVQQVLSGDDFKDFLSHMYGNQPDQWSEDLTGWDRLRFITNALTRLRFCTMEGQLDLVTKAGLQEQQPHYLPWFKVPNRKHKQNTILFGHWAALQAQVDEPHVFALDAGCVWGGNLLALRLEDLTRYSVTSKLYQSSL